MERIVFGERGSIRDSAGAACEWARLFPKRDVNRRHDRGRIRNVIAGHIADLRLPKSRKRGVDAGLLAVESQKRACEYLHTAAVDGQIWTGTDRGRFDNARQFDTGLQLFQALIDGTVTRWLQQTTDFTTTSMGRLTLNVLLSFAQFERELASERVRDKVAASRKKDKWTGGTVPLGYDAKDKKLVINKAEAETVQTIFRLYLELKSFGKLVAELDRRKIVTKRRDTKSAKYQGGIPFTYGPLAYFLKNRIYVGEMHHSGKWFKGEHQAILDRQTFERVQDLLKSNRITRRIKHSQSGACSKANCSTTKAIEWDQAFRARTASAIASMSVLPCEDGGTKPVLLRACQRPRSKPSLRRRLGTNLKSKPPQIGRAHV